MTDEAAASAALMAEAFNQGADARLAGRPPSANPHDDEALRRQWERGWADVHNYFGSAARWPVRRLPPIAYQKGVSA